MGIIRTISKIFFSEQIVKAKGKIGEESVTAELTPLIFGRVKHHLINNLTILDDMGFTHQIDHIEIRSNGIFCIETKNYKGFIVGRQNDSKWCQILYNEKNQFLNPIKQNNSHIYHLAKALNNKYHINSVVVFVQNNANNIDVSNVINLCDLKKYLSTYDDGTYYSYYEIDYIYDEIKNLDVKIKNRIHVNNIQKQQQLIRDGICPRCGAKLVERNGKNGKFIGCSNYPNCKFTKSI